LPCVASESSALRKERKRYVVVSQSWRLEDSQTPQRSSAEVSWMLVSLFFYSEYR
jgi:hypothetical protein